MRTALRWVLAASLLFTGTMHFLRLDEFLTVIPPWLPAPKLLVWVSGALEIAFAIALIVPMERRAPVGYALAIFFVLIYPGNIYQAVQGLDAFGLDSNAERLIRLPFQPIFIIWALWVTQAWPFRQDHIEGVSPAPSKVPE